MVNLVIPIQITCKVSNYLSEAALAEYGHQIETVGSHFLLAKEGTRHDRHFYYIRLAGVSALGLPKSDCNDIVIFSPYDIVPLIACSK